MTLSHNSRDVIGELRLRACSRIGDDDIRRSGFNERRRNRGLVGDIHRQILAGKISGSLWIEDPDFRAALR